MDRVYVVGRDGVARNRLIPDTGDGTVFRTHLAVFRAAVGTIGVDDVPCEVCDGSGWLPGFVAPG